MVAAALKIPQETVQAACNRSNLQRDTNGWYLLPTSEKNPQRLLFIRLCAKGPQTRAEQLRRDLGVKARR